MFMSISNWDIWPVFKLKKIKTHLEQEFETWQTHATYADIRKLTTQQLKGYLETEKERAKHLDDKLQKFTELLSAAIAICGVYTSTVFERFSQTSFDLEHIILFVSLLVLSVVSFICFLQGVMYGLHGLEAKVTYAYGANYLLKISDDEETAKQEMIYAACGFQVTNQIRANYASAAVILIKYGIILFSMTVFFSLVVRTIRI